MGRMSELMIEMQEDEAREEWIRDQLDDIESDQDSDEWQELELEYDKLRASGQLDFEDRYYEEDYSDYWDIEGKTRFDIFSETINNSNELMNLSITSEQTKRNLLVMLFGHIVAAVEAYLASTFIETVMSSEKYIKNLVETDPLFAKQTFSMKEIFVKKDNLENHVKNYLLDIIFHDIKKVKPMYKSVLDIDFNDVKWLFKAVILRHDCVHRAGYDKEGNEIELDKEKVQLLIENSKEFIGDIEFKINSLTTIEI